MNENKVKLHINTDIVIVGTGVGGLFTALNLPRDKQIVMITKADLESSDSFLAQGGICVFKKMKMITTVILKILCVQDIMKIEKSLWIS